MDFKRTLRERILVLDGAMGTMIQRLGLKESDFRGREFIGHSLPLSGFNDILNLTSPSAIRDIHLQYLEAGANIITTNTFNSNRFSLKDYGLECKEGLVERLNREGVKLVKEAIKAFEEKNGVGIHFTAGSIGPTNRSASMSPDITDPIKRNVSYDELYSTYETQIRGLIEGGADLLIFETFFDTLNLKAGLGAAEDLMRKVGVSLPIMVSATVSDNAGRILSGQTLQAFIASVSHFDNLAVIGLNCGFGPDKMKGFIRDINKINTHFTSCHPNAGLPDETGCYNVSPAEFVDSILKILKEGQLNIVGGCCGTTPEHIRVLAKAVSEFGRPHLPISDLTGLHLSGLDELTVRNQFIKVGERCNVAGSAKFLRLIKEGAFEEAAEIAKIQVRKGANLIDINMDDAMLESKEAMVKFIRYILAEPEVARVPFMIDSSKWEVIEAALKEIQGKGIVNSLSLKEGEEKFIKRACKVRSLGFALVVMAFDENGQADTFERKIEVSRRAYKLLTEKCGYHPEDIIFDVNVMTIGTGMKEHARYAIDFIEAGDWIKRNLPGARVSGGISNLSFAFRGKNKLREYIHVIFLHHAREKGMDMAIINPSQTTKYEDIPITTRNTIEDLIFDRDPDALDRLILIANNEDKGKQVNIKLKDEDTDLPIEEVLKLDLMKGELLRLEEHLKRALEVIKDPVKIIEGSLMEGMKRVGDLFGEGKMFLPQVVKTARTMKKAVDILTPVIEIARKDSSRKRKGKILVATVKGDVHDIGKNIVSTVLTCNNYEIIDLGIMVPAERIVEVALKESPDFICLSGLISPSLAEMIETVRQLSNAGIEVPVMVGGAATSLLHTALKIAPEYKGLVLHMSDASQNPIAASRLSSQDDRNKFIKEIEERYNELREERAFGEEKGQIIPYSEVVQKIKYERRNHLVTPMLDIAIGKPEIINLPLKELIPLINWKMFFYAWKLHDNFLQSFPYNCNKESIEKWYDSLEGSEKNKAKEVLDLYLEAEKILDTFLKEGNYDGKGVVVFEPCSGDEKNLYVRDEVYPMLRQQRVGTEFLSVSDYVGKDGNIGFFAVTAGHNIQKMAERTDKEGNSYRSLLLQTLADRLAEASAEWLQKYVNGNIRPVSIRPAWGYPMMPDQLMILKTQSILPYKDLGISLTENGAMYPPASISGIYISNPKAKYFMVGDIGEDQLKDYAERRGMDPVRLKSVLRWK
ncbi:MAG: methionine synthase [Muribaculaceae bacterium]|nr:methionine synthase [Muribaculaceae bacterium]